MGIVQAYVIGKLGAEKYNENKEQIDTELGKALRKSALKVTGVLFRQGKKAIKEAVREQVSEKREGLDDSMKAIIDSVLKKMNYTIIDETTSENRE